MTPRKRLSFFPESFPDESLFSLVARYHLLSGNREARDTLHELFGKHTQVVTSHIPSLLKILAATMPIAMNISVKNIIEKFTIFPYFRPFLAERQILLGQAAMKGDTAGGLKTLIGLVASQLGGNNNYRFCKQCVEREQDSVGQAYWHRTHQLPGVLICPEHGTSLYEVASDWISSHRHDIFLPTTTAVIQNSQHIEIQDRHFSALISLALTSRQLLHSNLETIPPWKIQCEYQHLASDLGLSRSNGRLYIPAFTLRIEEKLQDFPSIQPFRSLQFSALGKPNWGLCLMRKARKSTHPMKHLVFLHCLGGDFSKFYAHSTIPIYSNQTKPPTIISTQQENEFQQLKILLEDENRSLRYCAKLLGRSIMTIKIEATRLGIDVLVRPKTMTSSRISIIKNALNSAVPLKILAEQHNVSVISLYRILRMFPQLAENRKKFCFDKLRAKSRKRFEIEFEHSQNVRDLPDYMWLYRNDRDWLSDTISGRKMHATSNSPRVNWPERDAALMLEIQEKAELLRKSKKPTRVSKAAIGRSIGKLSILEKQIQFMPLSAAAIAKNVESTEDYQCRRLYWAASKILEQQPSISRWQLVRKAGIRSNATDKVMALLDLLSQGINENHFPTIKQLVVTKRHNARKKRYVFQA